MTHRRFEHPTGGRASEEDQKALRRAIGITGTILVVEAMGGVLANSLALLSDAGHMLTDLLALLLSLMAVQFSQRPPTPKKTYGFHRIEILIALINGIVLALLCLFLFFEAYRRFLSPVEVMGDVVLLVAFVGLAANGLSALILRRRSKENLNLKGAFLHVLGDALSSFGVIIGGVLILLFQWTVVDPIISAAIGLVILRGAYGLIKESVDVLLESTPRHVDLKELERGIRRIEGVVGIHHLHIWTITSGFYALSAHVVVDDILMSRTTEILGRINRFLAERFRVAHTTIQFECATCTEEHACHPGRKGGISHWEDPVQRSSNDGDTWEWARK